MEKKVLRVHRTRKEAKELYDKISGFYDLISSFFEDKFKKIALGKMRFRKGEMILEVGSGTGGCLVEIARKVGEKGEAYGIDISRGMLEKAREKLRKEECLDRVELCCGDAIYLPYKNDVFDAAFMSFTLELFDTPEIPKVLEEIKRVLKPEGRIGVVSLSKENGENLILRLYEWAHKKWPKYIDCRPIYVEESMKNSGYEVKCKEKMKMLGLPVEMVIGVNKK